MTGYSYGDGPLVFMTGYGYGDGSLVFGLCASYLPCRDSILMCRSWSEFHYLFWRMDTLHLVKNVTLSNCSVRVRLKPHLLMDLADQSVFLDRNLEGEKENLSIW